MKKIYYLFFLSGIILIAGLIIILSNIKEDHLNAKTFFDEKNQPSLTPGHFAMYNAEYQFMKLRDPATDRIPPGIKSRELDFTAKLPKRNNDRGQDWSWRGPSNIGGRMLCIAIDTDDENHLLSGSASGGMWQSNDAGQSWEKVTAPNVEQSATCLAQDTRPGMHDTWYYGTGELLSTTNRNISMNVRTIGIGDGIFKSTDNGQTWQALESTQGGSPAYLDEIFQGVWNIKTDPVNTDKDIVYAACYGAVMRSEDGGDSWDLAIGDVENKSFATDIDISSDGVIYAALSSYCWSQDRPQKAGVWRSENGIDWKDITPDDMPAMTRVMKLAIAPSDENVLYLFTERPSDILEPFDGIFNTYNTFHKYTYNPAADSGIWENRTAYMPGGGDGSFTDFPESFLVYGGYTICLDVKPDDEDVVMLAAMNMFRSENGFSDTLQTYFMGGYPYDMDSLHQLHPDQHHIAFLPSNPNVMFMGNDGGVYRTDNCVATKTIWHRLNGFLISSQFYSVCIDHGASGDDWILGGLQDNNWYYTVTDDPTEFWLDVDIIYDGFATYVAKDWEYCIITAYSGNIWTSQFDENMDTKNIFPQLPDTLLKYYNPIMGSNEIFPFYQNQAVDPNNEEVYYIPTKTSVWRKENMKAASYDTNLRNVGWSHLSNIDVGEASQITYITASKTPANRLYYGTSLGKVYRLDDAHAGNPAPVEITGADFPQNAFFACIDIDWNDADKIIVVFSNYNVQSLFYSENGGETWEAVGGNLEENSDGCGSGPSVRWVKSLNYQGDQVYFAGTSVGLYSTYELNGDSTIWSQEGAESIGSVIVDMIDARETDGFIAIGTHGNGVYSTYYNHSAGIYDQEGNAVASLEQNYPNPVNDQTRINVNIMAKGYYELLIYNGEGKIVDILNQGILGEGNHSYVYNVGGLPNGLYYIRLKAKDGVFTKKMIVSGP